MDPWNTVSADRICCMVIRQDFCILNMGMDDLLYRISHRDLRIHRRFLLLQAWLSQRNNEYIKQMPDSTMIFARLLSFIFTDLTLYWGDHPVKR